MKTLILSNFLYDQYKPENEKNSGYMLLPMLKSSSSDKIMRSFRKVHLHSFVPFKSVWLYPWEKNIKESDTVILPDAGNTYAVAKYLHKKYPKKRLIIWYLNPVAKTVKINEKVRKYCEIWSFDKEDCEKYNLKFNPQFCMKCNVREIYEIENDVFFAGADKGRLQNLLILEKMLQMNKLKTNFLIVGYNSSKLDYEKIVENIYESRVIVDFLSIGQTGLTLRPIEALLYKKKLITNNKDIINYEFYMKENIFILGQDNEKDLYEFCHSTYKEIPQDIVDKYSIKGWVEKFYKQFR